MSNKANGQAPASKGAPADAPKFSDRLNDFLRTNRKLLLTLGAVILVAVVGIGAYSVVQSSRLTEATLALEGLEADFDAWTAAADADKAADGDAVMASAAALRKAYPKSYAAQRASIVTARVLYQRKDYAGAEAAFASVADDAPASHLAPVSLTNAAAMAEERGDREAALAYLVRADEKYPDAPGSARVVFSIGRVHEEMKQYDQAMAAYQRLVATGADSDWTKLARDRIIFLRSSGLAK